MTDSDFERISEDIEYIKKAVKRNDPLLRQMATPPGWISLSLIGGTATTLFALPAHILSKAYGSFAMIPAGFKAVLFSILAILVVVGGIAKMALLSRKLGTTSGMFGFGRIVSSFFGGRSSYTTIPPILVLAVLLVYAAVSGRAWLSLPLSSLLLGLMSNQIGERSGVWSYYLMGYWLLITGSLSLFLAEHAVFLWVFIAYGGVFFAFAASLAMEQSANTGKKP